MGRAGCLLLLLFCHTCSGQEVTVPASQSAVFQTRTLLPCTFTVANPPVKPQLLAVFWHFGDKELLRYDNKEKVSSPTVSIDDQEVKQGNASLSIHNVTISDQGKYRCLVIYSPDRQQKEIQLNILAAPVVKINKKALRQDEDSVVDCSVTDFFPEAITVTWLRNGQALTGSVSEKYQMNADRTYNVNSSVTITPSQATGNPVITCKVEHASLRSPLQDGFRVEYGAAPTVRVTSAKTPGDEEQIYVCEARGYYPEAIAIDWFLDGKRTEPPRGSVNGRFNKEIYYRVLLNNDKRPAEISCEVQHETLYRPITKTLEVQVNPDCRRSCHSGLTAVLLLLAILACGTLAALWYFISKKKYFQRFQVSPIHVDPIRTDDEQVTLYCVASSCPADVDVAWTVIENGGEKFTMSNPLPHGDEEKDLLYCSDHTDYTVRTDRSQSPEDNLYNAVTALRFKHTESKLKDIAATCTFSCDGRSEEKSWNYSWTLKKPEISAPIQLSLCDSGDVLSSVALEKFYPRDIRITWSCGVGHYQELGTATDRIIKHTDNTYNAGSDCRVPGHLFRDPGFRVRVTWRHESMDEAESREVCVTDLPWRPVMDDIIKPPLVQGTEAKLQCRILGYYPGDLGVTWMRREAGKQDLYEVSPSDRYKIPVMEITQEPDKTYTCTASLIVAVSAVTEHGSEFICRVTHPTLVTPLEKRTGELRVTGIPTVNVTYVGKTLIAEILHFSPKDITVTWSRIKKDKHLYENYPKGVENNIHDNNDNTYTCISKKETPNDKTYKVTVEHETLKHPIEKIIVREKGKFYLNDNENRRTPLPESPHQEENAHCNEGNEVSTEKALEPSMTSEETQPLQDNKDGKKAGKKQEKKQKQSNKKMKPQLPAPIQLSLCDSGDVLCSVTLEKFYPRDIRITWSCGVGHYQELGTATDRIIKHTDYTFNAGSDCRVSGHLFRDPGFRVRVTWRHESMDGAESREVSVTDLPWLPVMDDIIKPPLVQGTEAKLQCRIWGYYPGDLGVTWMRREAGKQELYEVSPSDRYKIPVMEITQEPDKTYTCTASLIVAVSAVTEHGSEFICRVTHPTLVTPLEKRTGEIRVTE
ncbi:uncharacterized protein LOC134944447 [Pseudophryne corroboree]|uniref:uncharacterized protein LOC134944447 n=1 Tax=Pseudophryne corroboree TaxID=495146 RepID=UPI0030821E30